MRSDTQESYDNETDADRYYRVVVKRRQWLSGLAFVPVGFVGLLIDNQTRTDSVLPTTLYAVSVFLTVFGVVLTGGSLAPPKQ